MNVAKTVMSWRKMQLVFGAGVVVFALLSGLVFRTSIAHAASCDKVNIIYCGLSGSSTSAEIDSLQHYYSTSKDSYGNTDIRAVMQWGGWTSSMVNGATTTNTKKGTLYRNGEIKVGGVVVAKGTVVSARFTEGAGFTHIEGNVYYRKTTTSFAHSSVPVLVHFDSSGNADAAIMSDCGNVLRFTVVPKPVVEAQCTSLTVTLLDKSKQLYSFTANTKTQNATLKSGSFNFGDGVTATGVVSGGAVTAKHQYNASGSYTITATLKFSADGSTLTKTCQVPLKVAIPYYDCVSQNSVTLNKENFSYRFVAGIRAGGGATFVSATFDFGDGKTVTGVKSSDGGKTVWADHSYAKAGNYSASAVLYFSANGATVASKTCRWVVSPTQPPVPECKPGVPVGDIRCNPCEYDSSISADDAKCVEPVTTLPNTGAGNVIAVGAVAVVGGFLWYRHLLFRRHKAAFWAADMGGSPLPLAEPLESNVPLAGTPVDPATQGNRPNTLRRRRPF